MEDEPKITIPMDDLSFLVLHLYIGFENLKELKKNRVIVNY